MRVGGGGGFRGGGGGGFRGGGGGRGGGGRGGGGRRSDITLKHDIVLLGHLANGLGYYRFSYNGSNRAYVGVIAQEVQTVMPKAVVRDRDGSLRVFYDRLGIKFQTYEHWITTGARLPDVGAAPLRHHLPARTL
jgi:Chaperone of endosialidase